MKLPKLLLGTVLFFATCCEGCVGSRWLLPNLSMDPEKLAQEENRSSATAGQRSDRSDVADGDRDRQSSDHFANDHREGDTNDALANRPRTSSPVDPTSNLAKDDSESTAPNSSVSKQPLRDSANRERSKSAEERLDSQSTEVSSGSNVRLSLNADSANSSARNKTASVDTGALRTSSGAIAQSDAAVKDIDYETLRRELENNGSNLPPLLVNQMMALLERKEAATEGQDPVVSLRPSSPPKQSDSKLQAVRQDGQRSEASPASLATRQREELGDDPNEVSSGSIPDSQAISNAKVNPDAKATAQQLAVNRVETSADSQAGSTAIVATSRSDSSGSERLTSRQESERSSELESQESSDASADEQVGWEQRVQQALATIERELSNDSTMLTASERHRLEVQKRLLHSMLDQGDSAMKEIAGIPPEQRDYWRHQLRTLQLLLSERGTPAWNRRAALALRELSSATSQLAAVSSLDVKNLAFCSKVDGFGTLTEFPKAEFQPGQEVLLYVEVDHFKSELRAANNAPSGSGVSRSSEQYETELRANYQVFDASGRRVSEIDLPTDKQSCRSPRRDYFIAYRLYMPKNLEPGNYSLQLTMEDVKGQKFGQASLDFVLKGRNESR